VSSNAYQPILSIDFGTSYSAAYLILPGGTPVPVREPFNDKAVWPSAVLATGGDALQVGWRALDGWRDAEEGTFCAEFKRDLGMDKPIPLGNRDRRPSELMRVMFAEIVTAARNQLTTMPGAARGARLGRTVLTIPVHYSHRGKDGRKLRELMLATAEGLGLGPVELLYEPVAATWSARSQLDGGLSPLVLVYDFGGGTFDAALVQMGADHRPDMDSEIVGGKDIDAALAKVLRSRMSGGPTGSYRADVLCHVEAERLKRQLSAAVSASPQIPGLAEVTTTELEDLAREHVGRTVACCRRLLQNSGKKPSDLSAILLVGGASRMPLVKTMLRDGLPGAEQVRFVTPADPGADLAVAFGAAVWAAADVNAIRDISPMRRGAGGSVLRWDLGGLDYAGREKPRLMRWHQEPGHQYGPDAPLARIRVRGGALWDLLARDRGTLGPVLTDPPDTDEGKELGTPIESPWLATTEG
jgi:molecular chaperone DnaK (HSP70)